MPKFNYFHGGEAEQFSFFRIPRTRISDERFHGLSTGAKLLCGLILDHMGLSLRSGRLDGENRVFIFYNRAAILIQNISMKKVVQIDGVHRLSQMGCPCILCNCIANNLFAIIHLYGKHCLLKYLQYN